MSEKAYDYMMDSLKRIINFVEEVSEDWWWLERGRVPIISVRKIDIENGKVRIESLPKRPVIDALKVIQKNFLLIRNLPSDKRVDYAVKIAQDLYATLQAVANIIDAHELAEELVKIRNRISKIRPEALNVFLDKINVILSTLREVLITNVFKWQEEKELLKKRISELIKEVDKLVEETTVESAEEEGVPA